MPAPQLVRRLAAIVIAMMLVGCATSRRASRDPRTLVHADPVTVAGAVVDRFVHRHPARRLAWDWGPGILTFGMARLAATDPTRYAAWIDYVRDYHRGHPAPRIRRPDDCAPALAATVLLALGTQDVRPSVERVATYLRRAPRNELGALDHLDPRTALGRLYPRSIWVDSLVMYGLTAARVGQAVGDPPLVDWARAQPLIFAEPLQDPATGLLRHAYLHERRRVRPAQPAFWLRGNGWVAVALVELLADLEPDDARYAPLRAIFLRLTEGLRGARRADGLWNTLVGDRRTYVETSGSALVAYALARGAREGLLEPAARVEAEQTFRALAERLRARRDGLSLPEISGPTIPGRRSSYAVVPRRADTSYGVGAFALLAAELSLDREPT